MIKFWFVFTYLFLYKRPLIVAMWKWFSGWAVFWFNWFCMKISILGGKMLTVIQEFGKEDWTEVLDYSWEVLKFLFELIMKIFGW